MTDQTILNLPLEVKADGETGTFEGYGAVFGNLDRDGDVVARGAFRESLKGRLPALLWQHNAKEPIGRFDDVREDEKGLYVKGRLSMEGRGREAYELLKMGALDGLSIGFVTKEATRDSARSTRTITRAELMEISLVTFPANELARVSAVKQVGGSMPVSVPDTPREFERLLRDHGFSRGRAKAITAKGFVGAPDTDGNEIAALVEDIAQRKRALAGERKATVRKRVTLGPGETDYCFFNAEFGRRFIVQVSGFQSTPAVADTLVEVLYYHPQGPQKIQKLAPYKPQTRFQIGPPSEGRIAELFGATVKVTLKNKHRLREGTFGVWLTEV